MRDALCCVGGISIHAPPRGATNGTYLDTRDIRISIHAPPRGATRICQRSWKLSPISIHAPPRGATTRQATRQWRLLFQFTPLREGRPIAELKRITSVPISIHAPPRGATACEDREAGWREIFQFTPLREGRRLLVHTSTARTLFQFTPLREGRRRGAAQIRRQLHISIHAPPRGATNAERNSS